MKTKLNLIAAGLTLLVAPTLHAEDHIRAFLKIDGITGESTNAKHPDEIVVAAFKLNVAQLINAGTGGGGGAGKAQFSPLTVFKGIDKATPALFLDAATGKHLPSALLTLTENNKDSFKVKLSDVVISSTDINSNDVNGDALPLEAVTLTYSRIEITYQPIKSDGSLGQPVTVGFDVKTNTSFLAAE